MLACALRRTGASQPWPWIATPWPTKRPAILPMAAFGPMLALCYPHAKLRQRPNSILRLFSSEMSKSTHQSSPLCCGARALRNEWVSRASFAAKTQIHDHICCHGAVPFVFARYSPLPNAHPLSINLPSAMPRCSGHSLRSRIRRSIIGLRLNFERRCNCKLKSEVKVQ